MDSKNLSIVGLGGTISPGSSTEQALGLALRAAEDLGADVQLFGGAFMASLPHYDGRGGGAAQHFLEAVRGADGLIVASPGYHGSISGLVKNAIDYLEELAKDDRVYLDNMPVGLIVTAYGWQATGSTMGALRSIVHALRGWPTPLGVCVKTAPGMFDNDRCNDAAVVQQLELVGRQVVEFARRGRSCSPSNDLTQKAG